ncbi:MAG: hypothetical protein A2992_02380 [Elusimicrobia bacterium RIFCSPLOWO2_01_FULL_59_12]|nr:MAG: hypothetical protein A2992_02380 [Elusimicrobia bacterium RIFCSPLOWO2_01_FULL_59_12]
MVPSDGREIVFAGAGILWGAATFVRGLRFSRSHKASPDRSSVVVGFFLVIACSAYLAASLLHSKQ